VHLVGSRDWRSPGILLVTATAARVVSAWRHVSAVLDSIRTRLVLLALISTLPMLVLAAVNATQDVAVARQDAQMEALRVSQLQADLLDEHILAVDTLLGGITTSVLSDSGASVPDQAQLNTILAQLPPSYSALFVGLPSEISATASITADKAVVLSRPVLGPNGQVLATLNAATRLDRLPRLETRDLPSGSVVMILDQHGLVLARTPDYDAWVGRDLSDMDFVQEALRRHQGTAEIVGRDGVSRLGAYTTASRAAWLVYVGLPSEIVLGSSRVALLRNMWFGVLALGAAVLVAFAISGRITAPLRRLTSDARALGRGDLRRRTRAEARGEVGVLAAVFNRMAEDVERHVEDVQASHQREQEARLAAEAAAEQIAERELRLQDLVRRLQVAQEDERRRVAYEIHDGLAQVAASAHQHLQTFADLHVPDSHSERADLDRTVDLVQRTVREARRLIAGLRPTVLDDFGLATAIRMEVEVLRGEGWQVSYEEDLGDQRLPSQIETALYRVAQEALTNVRKHAGRARVAVVLERDDDSIRLQVRDWGRGFDAGARNARARPGERVGLLSMQERVALLHGRCTVTSHAGDGTQVSALVPFIQPASAEGLDGA
jgi:signal transduction histidine kinase